MRFFIVFALILVVQNSSIGQSLKVMTYNIRLDFAGDGVNQWPNRVDKVVALINKQNPDVIGLQEVLHHQLQDLLRLLPDYAYCGVGRDDGKEKGEYSAILFRNSRFGVLNQKTFWLSETPDIAGTKSWDAAITRIATTARFFDRETKKEFLMVNTHFDHIGKVARQNSARLIKIYLAGYKAGRSEIPILVSGDFNSEPTEDSYLTMIDSTDEVTLFDSKPTANKAGTFCGFKVGEMECKAIDFIFHTKEWVVRNYVVNTDNDGTYYPSDHLPVLAEFELTSN